MLLSLQPEQDINFLKWEAELQTRDYKFPHAAAQKLKEILLDDQIQPEEFIAQFNKILTSAQSSSWTSFLSLNNIRDRFFDQVSRVSWFPVLILLFIFCLYIFNKDYIKKKFKQKVSRKNRKKIARIIPNILERVFALMAYFVPMTIIYANYLTFVLPHYPYLNLIFPSFMRTAVIIYQAHPNYINYGYFFGIIILCFNLKLPKPRFIRFHLVRGIMLVAFQGIPDAIVNVLRGSNSISGFQIETTALCLLAINFFWILPCIYQAISHTYPRSSFIREAVEVLVGRDDTDDFKWWDR